MKRCRLIGLTLKALQGCAAESFRTTASPHGFGATRMTSFPAFLSPVSVIQEYLTLPFGIRNICISTTLQENTQKAARNDSKSKGLVESEDGSQITDQIPHIVRPMGVVEGTSYTLIIIAGLAFAVAVVWAVANELLIQPREYTCFNITLQKLQDDPRITVRLGTPISGYGQDLRNRRARQQIPHRAFKDASGREYIQVQFMLRGPSGNARVSAEMYQDHTKEWQYNFLYVDVDSPARQRLVLIEPQR